MWSRDGNTAYRMGRAIKAGRVWTNCYHAYPAHAAFGGYKQSGIGRETHKMMLDHYQQTKNLLVSYSHEGARLLLSRSPKPRGAALATVRPARGTPHVTLRAYARRSHGTDGERSMVTDKSGAQLIARLEAQHGPLMFHQSGGCCDGSAPMCYPAGEFRVGAQDVLLGEIAGCDFYIGAAQFEYWRHTHLIIDVVPGRGAGFSLEAPEGVRFLTRSRVFTDDEVAELEAAGSPAHAA